MQQLVVMTMEMMVVIKDAIQQVKCVIIVKALDIGTILVNILQEIVKMDIIQEIVQKDVQKTGLVALHENIIQTGSCPDCGTGRNKVYYM